LSGGARLNVVALREFGRDLLQAFLALREKDDINAARRRLARELLADGRGRASHEHPGTVHVLADLLHGTNLFWTE
jgi:hypothetical protein